MQEHIVHEFFIEDLWVICVNLGQTGGHPGHEPIWGGEPGCGTEHFIISALDYITNAMEDNRSALLLSSADFSKAFNRLEHSACLNAFKQKGASTKVLQLLASFLTGRTMTVKVGQEQPTRRPVDVCAPQGSVLGCFLFNIGIDDIEKNIDNPDTIPATTETQASDTITRLHQRLNASGQVATNWTTLILETNKKLNSYPKQQTSLLGS